MNVNRLTHRNEYGKITLECKNCSGPCLHKECDQHGLVRLADIEDTLGSTYDLSRIKELVEADRYGRCVLLPCNVGDAIYEANCGAIDKFTATGIDCFHNGRKWTNCVQLSGGDVHFVVDFDLFGEKLFSSRKDAENKLISQGVPINRINREAAEKALEDCDEN